jgi:hypothetical protein
MEGKGGFCGGAPSGTVQSKRLADGRLDRRTGVAPVSIRKLWPPFGTIWVGVNGSQTACPLKLETGATPVLPNLSSLNVCILKVPPNARWVGARRLRRFNVRRPAGQVFHPMPLRRGSGLKAARRGEPVRCTRLNLRQKYFLPAFGFHRIVISLFGEI